MGNPKWVRERARCHPLGLLDALHKKLVRDCNMINDLPEGVRRNCEYLVVKVGDGESTRIELERKPLDPQFNSMATAVIKPMNDGRARVNIYGVPTDQFYICMEWAPADSCCILTVDDEVADKEETDLNTLSQRILELLGFK